MQCLPPSRSCFCCGTENPIGLHLKLSSDGKMVETQLRFGEEHAGFRRVVHGGLTATLLDEVMAWACGIMGKVFAYCAELTVRYLAPVGPSELVIARGWLSDSKRGRLFLCRAELRSDSGVLLAEATGKYLPIRPAMESELWGDFDGDPRPALEAVRNLIPGTSP